MSYGTISALRCQCEVCGHVWITEGQPRRCAKCKSRKWHSAGEVARGDGKASEARVSGVKRPKPGNEGHVARIPAIKESARQATDEGLQDTATARPGEIAQAWCKRCDGVVYRDLANPKYWKCPKGSGRCGRQLEDREVYLEPKAVKTGPAHGGKCACVKCNPPKDGK